MSAHAQARSSSHAGDGVRDDGWAVPVLEPRPGGIAERFAGRLHGRGPAAVFAAALLAGFAVLAAVSILLGLIVTDVLLAAGEVRTADGSVVRDLVAERTGFLTDLSAVGSAIGGAPVLPILAGLLAIGFALKRHWRLAAFSVFVLVVESATYRVTSLLGPRERPEVRRLEDLPADASFPSGHTAAAVALYGGIAVLVLGATREWWRWLVLATAVVIIVLVAAARLYRGAHHLSDVLGSLLLTLPWLYALDRFLPGRPSEDRQWSGSWPEATSPVGVISPVQPQAVQEQ